MTDVQFNAGNDISSSRDSSPRGSTSRPKVVSTANDFANAFLDYQVPTAA